MGRLSFLTAEAWLDEDGYHVWLAHDCFDGQRIVTMLPWPTWHASEDGRTIEPSIDCDCGMHDFIALSATSETAGKGDA